MLRVYLWTPTRLCARRLPPVPPPRPRPLPSDLPGASRHHTGRFRGADRCRWCGGKPAREEVEVARVGFKLGGRGRTAAPEPEAAAPAAPNAHSWPDVEAPVAPQAPSPAVNILPGQPFSAPLPTMSSAGAMAGPTPTPNGWGT